MAVILVVALNPALDLTYEVDRLQVGATHRVSRTHVRAGGKPLNVAQVLGALGVEVTVVGFGVGPLPARFAEESRGRPITTTWLPVTGDGGPEVDPELVRRTTTVVDRWSGQATALHEPGPVVGAADWARLRHEVGTRLPGVEALVLSGSVPPGLPADAHAVLVADARATGTWVALDTDAPWLGPGLAAGPSLVKPNAAELARIGVGGAVDVDDVAAVNGARAAAATLRRKGAGTGVVSLGANGLVADAAEGCWWARPPHVAGNATGAGDAALAGLVAGSVEGLTWPERLRRAAALGSAAVTAPVAGDFRAAAYEELLAATHVTETEDPM